ncbi:hypothetical protein GE061_002239 [Apolygus lucorum]|uniref:carbonyl reductase (NADPH) n=1 Tax=Apolygus lucorum TaxID=248454 RepID=A0A8S9X6D2_APOLU|nr:hypothetical protein GE061_002239 [Apolygus lucorum]
MAGKVAVVTGSNKGIGLAIVRSLCSQFDGTVYLTARDVERGRAAVETLKKEGLNPVFHQLDVTDKKSIDALAADIKKAHGGLDILINNAAVLYMPGSPEPLEEQVAETLKTNYFALKNVCHALFPLLRPHARVVNLTSSAGNLERMVPGEALRKRFADPNLTEEMLDQLLAEYVRDVKDGSYKEKGWPTVEYTAYAVSKVAVSALTRVQHQKFLKDAREDIVINHVHPGYVATDLNRHSGPLTTEQGAVCPVYAALLPENCTSPKGDYLWHNKDIIDWVNGPSPSTW